jgi:hypothetical protein
LHFFALYKSSLADLKTSYPSDFKNHNLRNQLRAFILQAYRANLASTSSIDNALLYGALFSRFMLKT